MNLAQWALVNNIKYIAVQNFVHIVEESGYLSAFTDQKS